MKRKRHSRTRKEIREEWEEEARTGVRLCIRCNLKHPPTDDWFPPRNKGATSNRKCFRRVCKDCKRRDNNKARAIYSKTERGAETRQRYKHKVSLHRTQLLRGMDLKNPNPTAVQEAALRIALQAREVFTARVQKNRSPLWKRVRCPVCHALPEQDCKDCRYKTTPKTRVHPHVERARLGRKTFPNDKRVENLVVRGCTYYMDMCRKGKRYLRSLRTKDYHTAVERLTKLRDKIQREVDKT